MAIIVKLGDTLNNLNISKYKFSVESKIRANTIYDLIDNKKSTISWVTLNSIVTTLNRLSAQEGMSKKYTVCDIIEHIEDK